MKTKAWRRWALRLGAISALAWLWPALRHAVESSMAAHMLLQFPLLLTSGACAAAWLPVAFQRGWQRVDAFGLSAATVASCVAAYWMVPAALDAALLDPAADIAKHASWWVSGALLANAWPRLAGGLRLFFLGNAAWMSATAGLLYQDAPTRLCVNYLFDEQRTTGLGLVGIAGLLGVAVVMSWSAQTTSSGTRTVNSAGATPSGSPR